MVWGQDFLDWDLCRRAESGWGEQRWRQGDDMVRGGQERTKWLGEGGQGKNI